MVTAKTRHQCSITGPSIGKTIMATSTPSIRVFAIGPIRVPHRITSPQRKILERAAACLDDPQAHRVVTSCINGDCEFSLRLLDWFVTIYARLKNLRIDTEGRDSVHLYDKYKSALMLYKRRDFDPFRRLMRRGQQSNSSPQVEVTTPEGGVVKTTIGQLNFLCWAHRNSVIGYIHENKNEIEKNMQLIGRRPVNMIDMPPCSVVVSNFQVTL